MHCVYAHLREPFLQVGDYFISVLNEDAVQRGPALTVLSQHKEARVFLLRRRGGAVVLKLLHWDAEEHTLSVS